jgi:hypothetical protein
VRTALRELADALRTFRDIATLRMINLERPADRETDLDGGARMARSRGMNRLAERLEKAEGPEGLAVR